MPVYEIYKCGRRPTTGRAGLNLVERLCGLPAVVIPHYDNAEGGTHSTRFCYLGEGRLGMLERSCPRARSSSGVDEHTALVLDLAAGTAVGAGQRRR